METSCLSSSPGQNNGCLRVLYWKEKERIGLKNNLSDKTLREVVHGGSSGGTTDSGGNVHTFQLSGRKEKNPKPCR